MTTVQAVCVSTPETRVAKKPVAEVMVGLLGLEGDRHAGQTRLSPRGVTIPNRRQWSAVSTDEVEAFCKELDVTPFALGSLGENVRLKGIALAAVKPGTIFEFPSGCRLEVVGQNDPCEKAAAELAATYGPVVERSFVKASFGHRGVIGTVLAPGLLRPGDEVTVIAPATVATSS